MGDEVVREALRDYREAPLSEELRTTLGFLRKLTLEPEAIDEDDVDTVISAGVSPQALRDAIDVCAGFNVIDRIADTLEFALQTPEGLKAGAHMLSTRGYA
jgi:alkylhydroperoxidase family enzyme